MDFQIRNYEHKDAFALCILTVRSIREVACKDYSPIQVDAWATKVPNFDRMDEMGSDGRLRLVVVDQFDEPMGFGDLELNGHIDFFYCAPEAVGLGIGTALYEVLEVHARNMGITRLYVEASEAARRMFLRCGFVVDHRRELEIDGVVIHNYAMDKKL